MWVGGIVVKTNKLSIKSTPRHGLSGNGCSNATLTLPVVFILPAVTWYHKAPKTIT